MTDAVLALLGDPRLAPHVTSPVPAWLCTAEPPRVLWMNAAAAAMRGSTSPPAPEERPISPRDPLAVDLRGLAASLPPSGIPRLGRIRGLSAAIGRPTVCACSRLPLEKGIAILMVAAEPVEPAKPQSGAPSKLAEAAAERGSESATAHEATEPAHGEIPELSPPPKRRHSFRFVWQIDPNGRFTLGSREFAEAVGTPTIAMLGRAWSDFAAELGLDPEQRLARAIASRDTWSGLALSWPVEGSPNRLAVELSGMPVFDRDRRFCGYRGFGMCRDAALLAAAVASRAARPCSDQAPDSNEAEIRELPGTRPPDSRPQLTLVSAAENVVPFRSATAHERRPALSAVERTAFREIAQTLSSGFTKISEKEAADAGNTPASGEPPALLAGADAFLPSAFASGTAPGGPEPITLDQLPIGILVYRASRLIHANRALLDWAGYGELEELAAAGGLERIFAEPAAALEQSGETGRTLAITTRNGALLAVEGRLFSVSWGGEAAFMLVLLQAGDRLTSPELALCRAEAEAHELRSILDTATDGVLVIERDGSIASLNRSAEALFGYESRELVGEPFGDLFAPESRRAALDYLDGLSLNGVASVLNDGREVIGRVREGGLIPLFMTMGRIADGTDKFCAVLRDITQWKRAEEDLLNAKREAERTSSAKSDFLAKISHEIRTPLNAIIGFSEVMMDERFGPVGNERYRQYLKDIHTSGGHLVSLLNDLLDLSKIEAGKLDLAFTSVDLTALLQQCVALMQPQANRERIIIRSSLLPTLPAVVVDERSIRQIVLNLLSNSIKFTGAGGQVIVSTALTERGEAVLRVRDTGIGMSEQEIETALEPFRQLATSTRWGSGGTGLGLPLTKALVEANRATFTIRSAVNAGTLVEITFPATRVLAE